MELDVKEDDIFIDETPFVQLDNDSDSINVEQSCKRKHTTNNEGTQNKAQKVGRHRPKCWGYCEVVYIEEDDGVKRKYGRCKYCKTNIKADPHRNGTTGLTKHSSTCQLNPEVIAKKKQHNLVFKKESNGEGSVSVWKHDEARIKKALLDLFVVTELPFKLVENPAFIEYTNSLNGKFVLPARHKISKDIGKYYVDERKKIDGLFK
ncbi:hypothetical protein E3N88_35954 [Mikania micrantha]|uniref:BED-type domain-containing protein n=1 Tax=Mikania micrantha TaxID=192012 RepID=A0A5N6M2D6_9ASTR|nr:hypothetical protein E3N88_35954 [Mikania micrantha]